ncbi:MAG: glycosyltransferase family 2 protein [candidate division Zixibacteria bacterium]|nr:glycosyltransferase family 2 protein [candidate division Zixibacteria bacterium]
MATTEVHIWEAGIKKVLAEKTTSVSIVLVTYNSMPPLESCLESIKAGVNGTPLEIIGVDNSSSDNSAEMVSKHFPNAQVIRNSSNLGFAAACNQAAKHATGDYLLFLNPDVQVDGYAIEKLLDVFRSREKVGTAVGRMRFPDGSFQPTCRHLPRFSNMVYSRGSMLSKLIGKNRHYTLPDYDSVTPIPAAAGTMMMIRSDIFREIGGFDRRFFMFMEDVDLCRRLGSAGYTNYYVPSAGGVHLWGKGSRAGKLRRNLYHHWTVWKYFTKHSPGFVSYCLLPIALAMNFVVVSILPVPQPVNRA